MASVSSGGHKKHHRLGGFGSRHLFSHMSQEDKFKIQMPAELVSREISFWFTDGYLLSMSSYALFSVHA